MTSEEIYEYYGWMAFENGFFEEWRTEVINQIEKTLKEYEITRERAKISEIVFNKLLLIKLTNK